MPNSNGIGVDTNSMASVTGGILKQVEAMDIVLYN